MPVGSDEEAPLGDFIEDAEAMSAENAVIAELLPPTSVTCWPPSTNVATGHPAEGSGLDDGQPAPWIKSASCFGLCPGAVRQIEHG